MSKCNGKYIVSLIVLLCMSLPLSLSAKQSYTLPDGEVLFDPTEPYGTKRSTTSKTKVSMPRLSLNYIMSAGDNRRAMINGKKVYEGDYISGARIKSIESDRVSLTFGGKEHVLYLNKLTKIRK